MDDIRDQIDEDVVNELLTKELNNMNVDARNAMQEEMHGVNSRAIPETSELRSRSLEEFQRKIDEIERDVPSSSRNKKKVYNMILSRREKEIEQIKLLPLRSHNQAVAELEIVYSQDHYAIDDDDFRLRFLRVELFDVPKAVNRFLNYLNYTFESWGEIVLKRPICVKDILNNKDEAKRLRQAYSQILPSRDRSGRKIIFTTSQAMSSDPDSLKHYKTYFYVHDASTRDSISDQRIGVVSYFQMHGFTAQSAPKGTYQTVSKVMASIPVRFVAYHVSMPDKPLFRWFKNLLLLNGSVSLQESLRLVSTVGSEQECRYQQNTYGIPTQLYPLTTTGTIKRTYHKQWMKVRQLIEDKYLKTIRDPQHATFVNNIVECPFLQDVLFRKGTPSLGHFGNEVFRDMMKSYLERRGESHIVSDEPATNRGVFPDRIVKSQESPKVKTTTSYGDREDQMFCDQLIREIEINRNGRFLEWNQSLSIWVCMRPNPKKSACKIRQKILIAIYNCRRKAYKSVQKQNRIARRNLQSDDGITNRANNNMNEKKEGEDNTDNHYQFVEGGRRALDMGNDKCCDWTGESDASKKRKPNRLDGCLKKTMY